MAVNSAGAASKDLPLAANVDQIRAKHYMISLTLKESWDLKAFLGTILIVLEPVRSMKKVFLIANDTTDVLFECVLDCCDLKVSRVEEVLYNLSQLDLLLDWQNENRFSKQVMDDWLEKPGNLLKFSISEWSLKIQKDGVYSTNDFPRVLRIIYETTPSGASLTWAQDQSSKPCVFTQGAWINNRSLFPCQEPPIAMATWQASVTVPQDLVVLMTGDDEPTVTTQDGLKIFYFHTKMVLPMSTFAVAVGSWDCAVIISREEAASSSVAASLENKVECQHDDYLCYFKQMVHYSLIPVRVFAVSHLLTKFVKEFGRYILRCLRSAYHLLGPHPFPRLDILVVPASFASLGFASPYLLLVSQSLLTGDGSMAVRLAHEISHSWFGLSLGALDWTEEWLSEGFATFAEDLIHANAMQWSSQEHAERSELRALIRLRVLEGELKNTDLELQTLRPNQDHGEKRVGSTTFVKNGMNPDKSCTQVHYLKGYFLLRHLSMCVGEENFASFFRKYVSRFHGKLVLSKEILDLYFSTFPNVRSVTMESIYADWLDYPGMPKQNLISNKPSTENVLYQQVKSEFHKWKSFNNIVLKRKKRLKMELGDVIQLLPDQLVMLLEWLLEMPTISSQSLKALSEAYALDQQNADVRHRWCELVIKHNYSAGFSAVRQFLLEDQAMGVYLYGELVLSQRAKQLKLANDCFSQVAVHMDPSHRTIVKEMLGMEGELIEGADVLMRSHISIHQKY